MTQPQGPSAAGQHQALAQVEPRGSGSTKPSQLFPLPPPPPPPTQIPLSFPRVSDAKQFST